MSAEVTLTEDEREALGQRVMLAMTCNHGADYFGAGAVCETCFANTQRIGRIVERIVAARVEQAGAGERERIAQGGEARDELDTAAYWQGRFLRMRAMYRERFNEGLSTEDWHRKHCGLMNAHEVTADELAETLPDLLHAADDLPDDSPHQDTFRAVADAILAHYDVRTRP